MQYKKLRGHFSIYFKRLCLRIVVCSTVVEQSSSTSSSMVKKVDSAYRDESTVNWVIGHGIEFSLLLGDPPPESIPKNIDMRGES